MITYIDKASEFENAVNAIQNQDPFLTKILISYKSYGLDYRYTDYWYQKINEEFVSLIFRVDGQFILYLTDNSDTEEISAFLDVLGFKSLLFNGKYELNNIGSEEKTGVIMSLKFSEHLLNHRNISNIDSEFNYEITKENNLKNVFSFFNSLNNEDVKITDYGSFATDLHSKLRCGCGAVYSVYKYKKIHSEIVSCCIALTDGRNAIIGPVATREDYRQRNFAKSLISHINAVGNYHKLYLLCKDDIRKDIYTKTGFIPVGKWKEIYR